MTTNVKLFVLQSESERVPAFVHGDGQRVFQTQLVFFKRVHQVLQHLQTMAVSTVTLPDKDGVHDGKLVALGHEVITQAVCGERKNRRW